MLPRQNRLERKSLINIFKKGKRINFPEFTLVFLENEDLKENGAAFVVSSSVSKKSFMRNKLKRRARHIFLSICREERIKKAMFIFIFKKSAMELSFKELAEKLKASLINRITARIR